MVAIETNGLEKRYGSDIYALRGIDLTVEEGEVFGFLGPNGAGKSTTINVLLDFIRPTAGTARIFGHDAQENQELIRQSIGVLPEGYDMYDRLSARRHVEFAAQAKDAATDPDAILERVGLSEDGDRKVGGFSKGMTQRLALGIALVDEPDLIILDEPSSGLDPHGMRDIRSILQEEADRGASVFFSSHILSEVEAVCDRVGIMNEGELVETDTIDGLRSSVGGTSRIKITLEDELSDDLLSGTEIDGVEEVRRTDERTLRVECRDSSVKADVINAIERLGGSIVDIDIEEVSLEELFTTYTKKEGAQ